MYTLLTTQTHSAFVRLHSIWKLNISFISSYFKRVHVHLFSQKGYFVYYARENIEFIVLDAGCWNCNLKAQYSKPHTMISSSMMLMTKMIIFEQWWDETCHRFFEGKVKLRVIVDFTIYLIAQCNSHPHVAFCNRISARCLLLRAVVGVVVILHNFTSLYSYGIHTYKRKHVAYNINK